MVLDGGQSGGCKDQERRQRCGTSSKNAGHPDGSQLAGGSIDRKPKSAQQCGRHVRVAENTKAGVNSRHAVSCKQVISLVLLNYLKVRTETLDRAL